MANWDMRYLGLSGGAQMRYGLWKPAKPSMGFVLLVPGRTEFIEKYTEEAGEWGNRGYQALCIDLRGQGGSSREVPHKSHIDSFDTYVRDLNEFWTHVWLPTVGQRFGVVEAHSTGANIAIQKLAQDGTGADAFFPSAPMIDISLARLPRRIPPKLAYAAIAMMGRLAPKAYALGEDDFKPADFPGNPHTRDENRHSQWKQLQLDHPELVTGGVTWGWVAAARRSRAKLEALMPQLKVPTLAFLTPLDRVVDGPSQYQLKNAFKLEFPDEGHELFRAPDNTRTRLWAAKDEFLFTIRQQLPEWRKKQLGGPGL